MSKSLKNNNLSERAATRTLLAVSFVAAMAAAGCTTDRNLGNGDPVVTPGLRTSPIGGVSPGSESAPTPPPMMSSYSGAEALATVRPRVARPSAAEVAAILAERHQPRMRVLGPSWPGNAGRSYASDRTLSTQQLDRRYTINSSIFNPTPVEGIASGAGEVIGGDAGDAATFLDTAGVGSTAIGTTATTTNVSSAGVVTPTAAAIPVPAGFASVGTLSPTAAAVVNPPASVASSSTPATTAATSTTATTTVSATAVSPTNPVRVENTNGRVVVTNAGRQQ
jgi:hypothetical protein